jgi:hypothetical protein
MIERTGVGRRKFPPPPRSLMMLAQISMQRFGSSAGEQGLQHHVLAAACREMLAIGFTL